MPASKAQQKAVNKYMKENYDRFLLTLRPKGRLDVVKGHAAAQGESASGFINRAIQEAIERDTGTVGDPQDTVLTPAALETIQAAVSATGETIPQFVERAVETQARADGHFKEARKYMHL